MNAANLFRVPTSVMLEKRAKLLLVIIRTISCWSPAAAEASLVVAVAGVAPAGVGVWRR